MFSRHLACRLLGACALLAAAHAALAVTNIRTAAQEASEPKFVILYEHGKPAVGGICVDIMRAIERIDPTLRFVGDQAWLPLLRIEAGVTNGLLDACCGLLRTKPREAKYIYIDPPLFPVNYHLVVRADDDIRIENWNDVRRLGDQGVILVINGFGIICKLEEEGGLKIDAGAYTSKANFEKLLAGRGRFYYHRAPGIWAEIRSAEMLGKVKVLPTPMHSEYFHLVLASTLAPETVERIRKAVVALERNGELGRIFQKWQAY